MKKLFFLFAVAAMFCCTKANAQFTLIGYQASETAGIAFGRLSGEFIRTRVVPELDAFRLAQYASFDGVRVTGGDPKGYATIRPQ